MPTIIKTITLNYDEKLSYADVIDKIAQDREIQALIYIDKYFANEYQCKRAELMAQGLNTQQYLIITNKKYIESLTTRQLNAQSFDPSSHDRYMILKVNNEMEIWTISQSDFLHFCGIEAKDITLDTKGRAKGCVISNIDSLLTLPKLKESYTKLYGRKTMIAIKHTEITKNYGDSIIENVWVDSQTLAGRLQIVEAQNNKILQSLKATKDSMLETLQTAQDSIICLYTSFLDNEILNLVQEIGDNNRIYTYTKDQNTLQELSHHSLVRLGDSLAGSFVLI